MSTELPPDRPADPASAWIPSDDEIEEQENPTHKLAMRGALEWIVILGVALLAAFLIRAYLVQAFYIPSASMEDTLQIGDRVLVNKLSYRLHDVNHGDIIVFDDPNNVQENGRVRELIKRVIALPGDTVEARGGQVFVNNKPVDEPYIKKGTVTADFGPQKIEPKKMWVMGDNRGNSEDSTRFGQVNQANIVGRAFVLVWPPSSLGFL